MSRSSKSFVPLVSLTVLGGLACAVAVFTALTVYSRPAHFTDRVGQLQDRITEIKRLSKTSAKARDYVPGALCPSAASSAIDTIASALRGRADQLGLQTVTLSTLAAEDGGGVVRVSLQGEFSGAYPALLALLDQLATQTPKVFADQVDLFDRSPQASLRFSGHFYCSTAS